MCKSVSCVVLSADVSGNTTLSGADAEQASEGEQAGAASPSGADSGAQQHAQPREQTEQLSLAEARALLDKDHYGLDKVQPQLQSACCSEKSMRPIGICCQTCMRWSPDSAIFLQRSVSHRFALQAPRSLTPTVICQRQ